jgi:hypothetical protein
MKSANAIIVSFFLVLLSCNKKSLPEPSTEEPDFFLKCSLSGLSVDREAGNNDYYMNTSYYLDSGVYVVKGDLSKSCSGGCDYGFTVLINDFKPSAYGEAMEITKTLYKGAYSYSDKTITSKVYNVQLTPIVAQNVNTTYTWVVTSTSAPQTTTTNYNFSGSFTAGNTYTVTLYTEDISGCFTQHSQVYKMGTPQGNIQATRKPGSELIYDFTTNFPDSPGNSYQWTVDGNVISNNRSASHRFDLSSGYYQTSLRIITGNNDTCILNYQIPGTLDPICLANFSSVITGEPNTASFSRVTVIVTDPSGKKFTTRNVEQPATSLFYIDEISDYQTNNNGESTKKLKIRLNCLLRNGTDEIQLVNGEASIAVAYKQ